MSETSHQRRWRRDVASWSHDIKMAASMKNRRKLLAILSLYRYLRRRRANKSRSVWIRPWIGRRQKFGVFATLVQELHQEDKEKYKQYFRVDPTGFQAILGKVGPAIKKQDTSMRKSITPAERLAVTLRFLATGLCKFPCWCLLFI